VQPLWKSVWSFFKVLKIELQYDPAILLLSIYLKECNSACKRGNCISTFITAIFTTAKQWNQPGFSTMDEWIKKMYYTYTVEYYSALKKNEVKLFDVKWIELEIILLSKISHAQKNHILYVFTHTWV
jgi:hypothetical protein